MYHLVFAFDYGPWDEKTQSVGAGACAGQAASLREAAEQMEGLASAMIKKHHQGGEIIVTDEQHERVGRRRLRAAARLV